MLSGNTECVMLLLLSVSWLWLWVMDSCYNFPLWNNNTDMYWITTHMFGCTSFSAYFTANILVNLKRCYQTDIPLIKLWGQENEMTGAKSMGYFGMIDLSWLNQPSTPPLLSRISAQIKKIEKNVSVWGVDRTKGQIWWEFVRSNGDVLFWPIGELLFIPTDWIRGREILIKWAIFFLILHFPFIFFVFFLLKRDTIDFLIHLIKTTLT